MGHAVKGCPGDLTATGKERWRIAKSDLESEGRWRDAFHPTLERYVRALDIADRALEDLTQGGRLVLTALGSNGQTVQHPSVKTYWEAQRTAADAAEALGLSPRSRGKLGEPSGPPAGGKFGDRLGG
jgi:P27 family predicted phage terminase small subunit